MAQQNCDRKNCPNAATFETMVASIHDQTLKKAKAFRCSVHASSDFSEYISKPDKEVMLAIRVL